MPESPRQLISLVEAAERCDLSVKTLRRRIADGTLTAYRIGPRLIKVDADQLDQLLTPIGGVA